MNCSTPGFPVFQYLPEFAQVYFHWASDAIQPSYPLSSPILLPSIFPSIRVFSSESALCITWSEYWGFSFSTRTFNEYSGLISFRIDVLDFLGVQGTLKSLLQQHNLKTWIQALSLLWGSTLTSIHGYWGKNKQTNKNIVLTTQVLIGKVCLCFWICCLALS